MKHQLTIPRSQAPPEVLRAWDRLGEAWKRARGTPLDSQERKDHDHASHLYTLACRRAKMPGWKDSGGADIYPSIAEQPTTPTR